MPWHLVWEMGIDDLSLQEHSKCGVNSVLRLLKFLWKQVKVPNRKLDIQVETEEQSGCQDKYAITQRMLHIQTQSYPCCHFSET